MAFTNAKTLAAKKPAKAGKTVIRRQIEDLANYVAIVAVEKSLAALKELYENNVKSDVVVEFINAGVAEKKQPLNFEGFDGDAVAGCQLKKKASNVALKPEEIAVLKKFEIPVEEVVIVHDTFAINPEYLTDADIMARAEAALVAAGLPADFIMKQEGSTKTIVAENAMDKVFTYKAEIVADLLPLVSSIALKPKVGTDENEIANAFAKVSALLDGEDA
jgi:hypothetical protein